MAEVKQGGEAQGERRETSSASDDATVVAPRFDEKEAATARPVVPLGGSNNVRTGGSGGFSLRANSRHLLLAWAVIATLAAGGVAVYKSAQTSDPQVAPQPALESTAGEAVAATPQPTRREVPAVAPSRAAKMTEARTPSPSWEVPVWSDRGDVKRDELDEEELDERARKEEKRRRKEEKKRREEAEEQAEEEAERARKAARKQAERLRERQKDNGRKARLVGVLTRQD